jgi:dipeptidyl-peptidase-4
MTATTPTLERLFESPGLIGPVPGMARYAPDGRRIAFLRPADDDFERLDLWLHDLDTNRARCLVDARSLGDERELSEAEKARRERLRMFAAGIVEFQWNQDGSALLFPLAGRLYRLDPDDAAARPEPLTPEELFVTDVRVAASGAIGFVHEQNLWLLPPGAGTAPRPLTRDGGGSVSYGLPDFIAAEEMHRFDGYFFSPAGDRIAVLRVDEAPIPSSLRQEIDGDGFSLHEQHYPYAGGPNARVELGIIDLPDGDFRPLAWAAEDSEYLARVNWLPDGSGLLIQRQTRDQKRLDLVRLPLEAGPGEVVLREHSDTWINLADDLHVLGDGRTALWSSEREDVRRLYRLDLESGSLEALTPADGMVHRLAAVDEPAGHVFVEGSFEHPTRRQLYRLDLAGGAPTRLTDGVGCHAVRMAPDHAGFLDRHESLDRPPGLALRDAGGRLTADLVTNDPSRPDHPLHPYLSSRVRPELGEIEAEDGQRLCWRMTRPLETAAGRRHPVIVSVYGGPGVQRVQDAFGPLMHQYFASRGWGVLELDNRGSSGRGRRFESALHGRMGAAEVADQIRGVDMLRELDWVDPDRIGVFGHSYGGYMALMCLARHPEQFRAAVSVAPVTDWRLYDTHYTERYLGHPERDPAAFDASSVLGRIDGLAAADPGALLLMHGMADDNVLFTHSTRLMKTLQDRGIRFEFMAYPAAKHGLAGATTGLHRFRVIEAFLARRFGEDV